MAKFEEIQKFRQIWLWLVLLGLAAVSWYCFIEQIVLGKVVGSKPAPNEVVWVMWGVGAILIPGLFVFMNLKVTVEEGTLFIRFWPFYSRTVLVMDIEKCEARKYHPILEYGGWGIRYGFKKGWAYTVSGNKGVQVYLKNGKKFLIGSQKPEEMEKAIQSAR